MRKSGVDRRRLRLDSGRACVHDPPPPLCRGSAPVAPPVIYDLPPPDSLWQWPRRLKSVDSDVLDIDTAQRRIVDLTDAVRSFCGGPPEAPCRVFLAPPTRGGAANANR